ncbi:MAG: DNA polymerase III subunit beta [Proteobacteria bacterium]|jgi:DNA polymerase-3 subunit beta|nr:DNA polymerase III subunit beta [Desulfocapsa sp.]MBU3944646.1 DNA polymerase III subunit beta [Pseudomonadota bacterium]MCG2743246.1 DNA polymerase III subunit beta [Desulfobacteraceae bacterium]MDO8948407.1 DNA polymerase III subunit beta [Desulfocapsaceae bacterium]MBU4030293.1 DNA polymerase III subunit beta [Pseudomonadota bacterium]
MALNFNISKNVFLEGLNALQNLTNKRGTLAIISNILIETDNDILYLTATDLEVGLKIKIPAEIKNSGSITLPSKKIFEIVRESGSSSISIEETENSWVIIHAGLSTYNLAGMPSNEFPEFPSFNEETFVNFEAHVFSEIIDKIIYSIANEQENNYVLTSVLFEKEKKNDRYYIRMISSDGHRLSIMEKDVAADVDNLTLNKMTLIPKKGIQELKKFCENRDNVQISFEEKQLVVKDDNAIMVIRLKQGEFPPYRAIIDAVQLQNKIKINRVPFLESLKRINLFTEDIYHTIQLEIMDDIMILSSQNADIGNAKDEQSIIYNGENLTLGFNCRFFIETLQVMECETVDAYINSNNSPCLLKSDFDEGFLSIIMPMQL